MRFCSECKYAKVEETQDGLFILCSRHQNPTNIKAQMFVASCTVYKRLNSYACGYFVDAKKNR